ncbi:hypothetical protein QBC46DRAFT_416312 [Diplogelasinospora grovesii]|uniref:HNH nuclease domain-containing protein n=1 Tax=Diplogelasinospora grovesii TaxID=303347 RepID=A0AAN6N1F5_9PEZI|nr:hypothetical protein QBC46DRAFT_416312 [Diplogelasinospora grovesii]
MSTPKTPKKKGKAVNTSSPSAGSDISLDSTPPLYSPHVRQRMNKTVYDSAVLPLVERASALKRNFSELSAASSRSIRAIKLAKGDRKDVTETAIFREHSSLIKAIIESMELEFRAVSQEIETLVDEYEKGDLEITAGQQRAELARLETHVANLQAKLVVARTQKNQLAGELTDRSMAQSVKDEDTSAENMPPWGQAYIDLLLDRYRNPPHATLQLFRRRTPEEQDRFRKAVLASYGAYDKKKGGMAWCCVSGAWCTPSDVVAAHIVPYNVSELHAEHLFGQRDGGHLMRPENGIPMRKVFKEHFDNAEIGFVPVSKDSNDYKIVVLVNTGDIALPEVESIQGNSLQFPNDFRPTRRYMYFSFIMSLLRLRRHRVSGWNKAFREYGMKEMWVTPGPWVRQSTLLTLAHRVGHMSPEETSLFLDSDGESRPEVDESLEELVSDVSQLAKAVQAHSSSFDSSDEDDLDSPLAGKGIPRGGNSLATLPSWFNREGASDDENEGETEDDSDGEDREDDGGDGSEDAGSEDAGSEDAGSE